MSTDYGRFGITLPDDTDSPNGPANLRAAVDDIAPRLGYAGARGGKAIIPGAQTRLNAAYGLLGTPDRVQGIDIQNADDVLCIAYEAIWKCDTNTVINAAIFIGSNQLKRGVNHAVPAVQEAVSNVPSGAAKGAVILSTDRNGLISTDPVSATDTGADVSTGQILGQATGGGHLEVFGIALGTYDISVQFKAAAGTVTVSQRRLYAWIKEFPTTGV